MTPSPNFPCGYCGARGWTASNGRWVCENCRLNGRAAPPIPEYDKQFDFDTWYDSTFENWDRINKEIARLEGNPPPEDPVAIIIYKATLKKLNQDLHDVNGLCDIATFIQHIKS